MLQWRDFLDQGRCSSPASSGTDVSIENRKEAGADSHRCALFQLLFLQDPAHGATAASGQMDLEKNIRSLNSKPHSCDICARSRGVGMRFLMASAQISPGGAPLTSDPLGTVRVSSRYSGLYPVGSNVGNPKNPKVLKVYREAGSTKAAAT